MFGIGDDGLKRRGIEAGGLVLLLCLLLASGALGQRVRHLRVRQTATQSLTLIKPSDPAFEVMIDTYYPGLSDEPGYQKSIRPFLVVVRNDTALPAMAYAITWTVHYAEGHTRRRQAVFVNSPLMDRAAMKYIPPGIVRLISPMFNVTPKGYAWYHSFGTMYPASSFPPSQGLVSVDAQVDGVVYRGGTFIGADKTRVLQRYVMARFAARDEMLAALKLIESSTVPQAMAIQPLAQMLNQQIQWGFRANQGTLLAMYVRARGRSAQGLERILRSRGVAGMEKLLQRFVDRSGSNTNPSSFGREYSRLSDKDPRVFGTMP